LRNFWISKRILRDLSGCMQARRDIILSNEGKEIV
jgi:hypothetical protein